jgi:tRNA threonylcarbamoyladenosine biosynthesis protein TsaB
VTGIAIETATSRVDVVVQDAAGRTVARRSEDVGNGHMRRLTSLVRDALAEARVPPIELRWVAADLGPGSFTGIRVGLATAAALSAAAGAERRYATSLAALAHAADARGTLLVPLVPAGRADLYAGFFRADRAGAVHLMLAPEVGRVEHVIERAREALSVLPRSNVRFLGPGAAREREALEKALPGSTTPFRDQGLSAEDLARAAAGSGGAAAGLTPLGTQPEALYVRPAQAEELVRHRVAARDPARLRPLTAADLPVVLDVERRVFSDPWPESFFLSELRSPEVVARVAERGGTLAGYSMTWLGHGEGHIGNLAVVPGQRRRGVASALLDDVFALARARDVQRLSLEVRVSNFAAQWLYRRRGFRLAGLRRRYYRDTGEDALILVRPLGDDS